MWAAVQTVHVGFRYMSLSQLRFSNLNHKRACLLVAAHVAGKPLPSVEDANQQEPMLASSSSVKPSVQFGVSLKHSWGDQLPTGEQLQTWLQLYEHQQYVLVWRDCQAYVVLKSGYSSDALLRALWQAAWLDQNSTKDRHSGGSEAAADSNSRYNSSSSSSSTGISSSSAEVPTELHGPFQQNFKLLQCSLQALTQEFDQLLQEAQAAGWDTNNVIIKVATFTIESTV